MPRSASIRTTPRRWIDAGWSRIVRLGRPPGRASRSVRRGSTTTGRSARSPCSTPIFDATSTWPSRPASRRSSTAARPDGRRDAQDALVAELRVRVSVRWRRDLRRDPRGRPFLLGTGRLRARDARPRRRDQLLGPGLPRGEEASAEAVVADRPIGPAPIETDSPFLAPPGRPPRPQRARCSGSRPPGPPSAAQGVRPGRAPSLRPTTRSSVRPLHPSRPPSYLNGPASLLQEIR